MDLALALLALALAVFTALVATLPFVVPALYNDRFDVTIVTAGTLVSGAVAALDWARSRVVYDPAALLRSSAFTVLALLNSLTLVSGLVGADAILGATLDDPGQLPLIAGVIGRSVAAALLVAAAWVAISKRVPTLRPGWLLVAPAAGVLLLLLGAAQARDALPKLVPDSVLQALANDPTAPLMPGSAPALVIVQSADRRRSSSSLPCWRIGPTGAAVALPMRCWRPGCWSPPSARCTAPFTRAATPAW